jgi:putative transposase
MPNHFHGLVIINETTGVGVIHELPLHLHRQRRRMTLPLVIGYFKMNSARRINEILRSPGVPVWQRNYYEHIIHDDDELQSIHLYIKTNVDNWVTDDENPVKAA